MAIRDDSNGALYVSSDIIRYRNVDKVSDYLEVKARRRVAGNVSTSGRREGLTGRWQSMSGIERMTAIIVTFTIIAALATVATLFLAVW
jgi:hypothetical protein